MGQSLLWFLHGRAFRSPVLVTSWHTTCARTRRYSSQHVPFFSLFIFNLFLFLSKIVVFLFPSVLFILSVSLGIILFLSFYFIFVSCSVVILLSPSVGPGGRPRLLGHGTFPGRSAPLIHLYFHLHLLRQMPEIIITNYYYYQTVQATA